MENYIYLRVDVPNFNQNITFNVNTKEFEIGSIEEIVKLFKHLHPNKNDFKKNVVDKIKSVEEILNIDLNDFCNNLLSLYDELNYYNISEAFMVKNDTLRFLIFSTMDIGEMISGLGFKRIAVDGKTTNQKRYDINGNYLETIEMSNIYEIYEVSGEKLGIDENVYALKCWCTTTEKEHWLWIDEEYKNDPLSAVASTFRIHKNLIPYIKEIKRQGDILFVEMNENSENIKPDGEIVPLTAEQYFKFLSAQS